MNLPAGTLVNLKISECDPFLAVILEDITLYENESDPLSKELSFLPGDTSENSPEKCFLFYVDHISIVSHVQDPRQLNLFE